MFNAQKWDINVWWDINETKIKRRKCLMLNLKVNRQTGSEASENKVRVKRVSNILIN